MVKTIKPEMLNQLDSVERLIAEQFILEGKWRLEDTIICSTCVHNVACEKSSKHTDCSVCGEYQGCEK